MYTNDLQEKPVHYTTDDLIDYIIVNTDNGNLSWKNCSCCLPTATPPYSKFAGYKTRIWRKWYRWDTIRVVALFDEIVTGYCILYKNWVFKIDKDTYRNIVLHITESEKEPQNEIMASDMQNDLKKLFEHKTR